MNGMGRTQLSQVGQIVRRHDPDRFFTALFAPPEHRDTLFTLYAFNHELARASEVAREPIGALIRLQWWREVLDGARRRHEVAGPLGDALESGRLLATDMISMVDAREAEVDGIPDLAAFIDYVEGTAGGVMVAAARALGMSDAGSVRRAGAAYGISGILRRPPMPRSLLPATEDASERVRQLGLDWSSDAPLVPRDAVAAALPFTLARRRLRGSASAIGDRLAVVVAGMRGQP